MSYQEVLKFWFEEAGPKQWFSKDEAFDEQVRARFTNTYWAAVHGETKSWRTTPEGRLAEILVLDQFARNMFRDEPRAFLADPLSLALAREAVRQGLDVALPPEQRHFLYMPYMHSESPAAHEEALTLFEKLSNPEALKYEREHKKIIDHFGRYPHRNAVLGRTSTPEEREFLKTHKGF